MSVCKIYETASGTFRVLVDGILYAHMCGFTTVEKAVEKSRELYPNHVLEIAVGRSTALDSFQFHLKSNKEGHLETSLNGRFNPGLSVWAETSVSTKLYMFSSRVRRLFDDMGHIPSEKDTVTFNVSDPLYEQIVEVVKFADLPAMKENWILENIVFLDTLRYQWAVLGTGIGIVACFSALAMLKYIFGVQLF